MTDSTRVNDVQEKLLQAMDIISAQSLRAVAFDKTILCTIEDDSDKKEGKYQVTDGSISFTAYSDITNYSEGTAVYVTIPQGNYNNQKIIIGKKTATEDNPYVIEEPFDALFDLTGNIVEAQEEFYALTANSLKGDITIADFDCDLPGYSRLGFKAEFQTFLSQAVKGKYGIQLAVTFEKDGKTTKESFDLTSAEMFGNPYNFETYYEQQEVVDIEDKGTIKHIQVVFYQNRDFYDKNTVYLPCSFGGYETDSEGLFIIKDGAYVPIGEEIAENIFIKNLFICAGDDASKFTSDYVELYTKDTSIYTTAADEKQIGLRWIHIGDTPVDIRAAVQKETIPEEDTYEIRWYRYSIGAAAADEYCGVYWERIDPDNGERIYWYEGAESEEYQTAETAILVEKEEKLTELDNNESNLTNEELETRTKEIEEEYAKKIAALQEEYHAKSYWYSEIRETIDLSLQSFECRFSPNPLKNNEKIKVIAFYNGVAYRGQGEMLFTNTKEVFDASSAVFVNALQIVPQDTLNGNYLMYGQNAQLQDSEASKQLRTLKAFFDVDGDGTAESEIQPGENLKWIFPVDATMIKVANETIKEYQEIALDADSYQANRYYIYNKENDIYTLDTNENISTDTQYFQLIDTGIVADKTINPTYTIDRTYSASKSNNTIYCEYVLEGVTYTTEKEFTFGPKGTMGTDQTIVIDFVDDSNAIVIGGGQEVYRLQVQVYDEDNQLRTDEISNIKWSWYYASEQNNLKISDEDKSIVTLTKGNGLSIDDLYIIQVSVGDLTTYFPIPLKREGYSYITGPTQVIYRADGAVDYSKEPYTINGSYLDLKWRTRFDIEDKKYFITVDRELWGYDKTWQSIAKPDTSITKQIKYIGQVQKNYNAEYILQPLSIYVEDSLIYGVQGCFGDYVLWTQPILVLQNKWSSNVINNWDGKSLVLDEENSQIIAAAIVAGKKNSGDNTFSGVMMGDWSGTDSEGSLTECTGVYGFNHGAMSYAFKDDGTAFLGKDGVGRINFDGNKATIQSATYALDQDGNKTTTKNFGSMKIDLNEPSIYMNSENGTIYIDGGKTGNIGSADSSSAPFKIGSQFAVDWDGTLYAANGHFQGKVTGDYGQIGKWKIENKESAEYWYPTEQDQKDENNGVSLAGALYGIKPDTSSTPSIILNPNGDGSIILGTSQYNRIVLDASGNGTIKMGRDSILQSGILSSVDTNADIRLRGALTVQQKENDTYSIGGKLGFMTANFGPSKNDLKDATVSTSGIGFEYGREDSPGKYEIISTVKATDSNAGMSYGNYYLSLQGTDNLEKAVLRHTDGSYGRLVLDSEHIGIGYGTSFVQATKTVAELKVADAAGFKITSQDSSYKDTAFGYYLYCNVPSGNQYGIYARFA